MIFLTNLSAKMSAYASLWSCAISTSRSSEIGLDTFAPICDDRLVSPEPISIDVTLNQFTKDTNVGTNIRTYQQFVLSFSE